MMARLMGWTDFPARGNERVTVNIAPDVRDRLRDLLVLNPEMQGVGFSEFVDRAVTACEAEITAARTRSPA